MPHFDIVRQSKCPRSFRVAHIMGDYDLKGEKAEEHFVGDLDLPSKWNIDVIYGNSGTGKTTIAKELFSGNLYQPSAHGQNAVVDDMPKEKPMDEICKTFYAVGFGSVPSWLKPYDVLSNGEKMRVDMADALLKDDFVVFDEYTSVVDRDVAKVVSLAISKAVKRDNKQFVAVSCHDDIIPWLQPDWVFDTNTMQMVFPLARALKCESQLDGAGGTNGQDLGVIII